ncbi:MAG TPA: STAS domain-containing protein, partial [Planctomycetota bacterium]|nr:STAS domain-containing protein [Planctomycetota bacterium]
MTDRPRVLAVGLRITRRKQGEAVVLELAGRLDASLDRHLLHALEALTEAGERRIVLDLGGLEYLGSRGVSAF